MLCPWDGSSEASILLTEHVNLGDADCRSKIWVHQGSVQQGADPFDRAMPDCRPISSSRHFRCGCLGCSPSSIVSGWFHEDARDCQRQVWGDQNGEGALVEEVVIWALLDEDILYSENHLPHWIPRRIPQPAFSRRSGCRRAEAMIRPKILEHRVDEGSNDRFCQISITELTRRRGAGGALENHSQLVKSPTAAEGFHCRAHCHDWTQLQHKVSKIVEWPSSRWRQRSEPFHPLIFALHDKPKVGKEIFWEQHCSSFQDYPFAQRLCALSLIRFFWFSLRFTESSWLLQIVRNFSFIFISKVRVATLFLLVITLWIILRRTYRIANNYSAKRDDCQSQKKGCGAIQKTIVRKRQ